MINEKIIDVLEIAHGAYNAVVALLFIYLGFLGWKIRMERKAGGKRNPAPIRRHRKWGPLLAVLGIGGYFAGIVVVYLDKGHLYEYPLHLIVGTCIAMMIAVTYLVSRKINRPESPWRTPHFLIGLFIIFLYLVQIILGLFII
jgi:Protein of unknown function (DUF4079)